MSESKKNIELNNGWILCPSKSFPGKFYYFNVVTGETAWSQNQPENISLKRESSFQNIADISHRYPEPTTLPEESAITYDSIFTNIKNPDFLQTIPQSIQLPTFGQVTFPKTVPNIEPVVPNIVWTLVPMLCPETRKPKIDKVSPIMEYERELFAHSSNIPLCKRFKNFEKVSKFKTSTPKNSILECIPEQQSFIQKSLIKEPSSKLEPTLPTINLPDAIENYEKAVLYLSNKVESITSSTEVTKIFEEEPVLGKLESSDLRYLLMAKRKSFGAADSGVERKKPKADEIKTRTPKKKVTFSLIKETDEDTQDDFIPLTPNLSWSTIESPKSPLKLKDKIPPSFVKQTYETPPPNVKAPPFQAIVTKQLPTFQLTATKQQASCQQSATNHTSTFHPTVTNQTPTFQPTATNQTSTFQTTATNQTSTFQTTATNLTPTFQPIATKQTSTFQSTATNQTPTFQPTATNQTPTFKNTTWYIVVDTDVLLLDYEFIEKLVLSDPKCRLVIPHMVVSDIEALCLGDCRGQQRVINARQLTRKLATPQPHCIVEPRTSNGNLIVTTDSILHCCMKAANKKYYVVLITNDPYLLIRATTLNIPAYKLNEIQYGVDISPKSALEQKKNQNNNTSNDTGTKTIKLLNHKRNVFSNFKIESKSDEKISGIKQNVRNTIKQLSLSNDSETSSDDKFVNVTKPKCVDNIENIDNFDSDGISDISSTTLSSVPLTEKNVLKPQNVSKNPSNFKENGFVNFEKRVLNPNAVFRNENPIIQIKNDINKFQNDYLDYNLEKDDEFYSVPITNMAESNLKLDNSVKPNKCLTLRQASYGLTREGTMRNPSQMRIEKIMNTVNMDSTKTKESSAVFKIPKLLPIKNKTRNKTVHGEKSTTNVKIGTRTTIDSLDQSLKKFRIQNKTMRAKINTRSDEWICTYMQIMEDVLVNLMQRDRVCMENTVAPLTIKDILNCIKMLYDTHTKVRDVINKLSELLEKCMIGVQGQFKIPVAPEDFMKIFGCGVLLVQALQNILPENEELKEAESRLNSLQINLQSNAQELDPELVKSPYPSRNDKNEEEIRPQFIKNTSYVLEYLKKHFKEWETYEEHLDEQNHKIENHNDFKVVRTLGKNLNLFKIDKKKNMSLTNITKEDKKHEFKIMRQLENNQMNKSTNIENVETKTNNETKLIRLDNYERNKNDLEYYPDENLKMNTDKEKYTEMNKITNKHVDQNQNFKSIDDEFNCISHQNTYLEEHMDKDGPKNARNVTLINEYEAPLKKREPLDLDLLDYSEIYEPSIDKNVDFDILSDKNTEKNNNYNFEVNVVNCAIETPIFTLEDFYITPTVSPKSEENNEFTEIPENNNRIIENIENVTSSYFNTVSENKNVKNTNKEEKNYKNNISEIESETFTDKQVSNNDSCIGNDNSDKYIDNSETRNYDFGIKRDNSNGHNKNFRKTAQIVQDDSINDSGFENDSTYAHSVLKVFLKELCSTFMAVHTFINKFIDEISKTELSAKRMDVFHNQASKALEDMVAIINHLKAIIKRESSEDTVLKMLLRNAGVEATADKRMMRYRAIVIKCLEQAKILESALKIIISTTVGDFDALSTNSENIHPNVRYFNIFEPGYQPFVGNAHSLITMPKIRKK